MATTSEASRLQMKRNVMRVTWITVGLLALLGFASCGVGVDDPVGQQAATGTSGQALLGPDGMPAGDPVTEPGGQEPMTGTTGPVNPGVSSLPSDPVPLHSPDPRQQVIDPMTGLPIIPATAVPVTQ
jgi:hypothetical protein